MKSTRIFILLLLAASAVSFGQLKNSIRKVDESRMMSEGSYAIDPQPMLEKFSAANGIDMSKLSTMPQPLKKTSGWGFTVGSVKTWYASDFVKNNFYQLSSTCRSVGTNCYIFVEDSSWTGGRVNQTVVDSVQLAFDSRTPANPHKGVYQTDVDTFGTPPDVDGDPKIVILILNIRDGYDGVTTKSYVAGYFYSVNEVVTTGSNQAEIYYLDCKPANLTSTSGLTGGMQTTAHEFQHMIHYKYNQNQTTFINEACSMCAEVVNGYAMREQGSYNNETNHYLLDWRTGDIVLTDYSRAARYMVYLWEQFGAPVLKNIVQSGISGVNDVSTALSSVTQTPPTRTFSDALEDWFIANELNDKTVSTRWGYSTSGAGKGTARVHLNPNVTYSDPGVPQFGVQYISFTGGSNLKINFNAAGNSSLKIKAIKEGSTKAVETVTPGQDYTVPTFGSTYSKVTFAVYITDPNLFATNPAAKVYPFSYTASGTYVAKPMELAYDNAEPSGVLSLTPGDSVAVAFDGVAGARLDSIRVALRQAGPVYGGVYAYAYTGGTSKMGGKALAAPITVNSTIAVKPPSPYPVPWTNWVKLDLTSYKIDASNAFVVRFLIEGTYPATNRIMIIDYPSSASYHSFFYQGSVDVPQWVYYTDSGNPGNIFLNLIRAYVSFPTGVKGEIELMPASFKLAQNYPNPFNPSTIISYQIPAVSNVSIKVFDILGRQVADLVNEEKAPGSYKVNWNGSDMAGNKVTSGIYFYTIKAGSFVETKKMILMK